MNTAHLAIDPASSSGLAWLLDGQKVPMWGDVSGLLQIPSYEPLKEFLTEVKRRGDKLVVTVECPRGFHGASQVQYAGNQIIKWLHTMMPARSMTVNRIQPRQWQSKVHCDQPGENTKDRSRSAVYDWLGERVEQEDAADALCILKFATSAPSTTPKTKAPRKPRQKRK